MSITSETISQQPICWDNEGLNADVETNKEQIKFEQKPSQLSKAREIYFKYFSSQKIARTRTTIQKLAKMGLSLVSSIKGKTSKSVMKSVKGKTPQIGIKWLKKIRPKGKTPGSRRQWPGTQNLQEIQRFQKSMELLIPKAPFLQLVREIL